MRVVIRNNTCAEIFKSAKINLSFWEFGLEISGTPQITDKEILYGIAVSKDSQVKTIRQQLKMDTNSINPYRKKLIKKGILNGAERGSLTFTLPAFEKFVIFNCE